MQRTVIAVSTNPDFEHAFAEVTDKIKNECASPKLIMFFSEYNSFYMFATKLQEAFPNTVNIGSTSYINFSSAGYGHNSLAAMAINDGIEVGEGDDEHRQGPAGAAAGIGGLPEQRSNAPARPEHGRLLDGHPGKMKRACTVERFRMPPCTGSFW